MRHIHYLDRAVKYACCYLTNVKDRDIDKYKHTIDELTEEIQDKATKISDNLGIERFEAIKQLLTAEYIDNSCMDPKYLFRAVRANTYRRLTHDM